MDASPRRVLTSATEQLRAAGFTISSQPPDSLLATAPWGLSAYGQSPSRLPLVTAIHLTTSATPMLHYSITLTRALIISVVVATLIAVGLATILPLSLSASLAALGWAWYFGLSYWTQLIRARELVSSIARAPCGPPHEHDPE